MDRGQVDLAEASLREAWKSGAEEGAADSAARRATGALLGSALVALGRWLIWSDETTL